MGSYIEIKSWHALLAVAVLAVLYIIYKVLKTAYCSYRQASCGASKLACDAGNTAQSVLPWNWFNGYKPQDCAGQQKSCEGRLCG
jgi:hypothetical protein